MKTKRERGAGDSSELKEAAPSNFATGEKASMIRTQVYLTPSEHQFLQAEAHRRNRPMAAILREFIDEKMQLPETAWGDNPMLRPTPRDSTFSLPEDAAINHEHYLYGTPRKYVKVKGCWVLAEEAKR